MLQTIRKNPKYLLSILSIILAVAVVLVLFSFCPIGDYTRCYAPATRAFLSNSSELYDYSAGDFYNLPWSLWLLIPLSILPDTWGQAVLMTLSLIALLLGIKILSNSTSIRAILVALLNPFTLFQIAIAQWDSLIIGAVGAGWWALQKNRPYLLGFAIIILLSKPVHGVLPAAILFWVAIRNQLPISKIAVWPLIAFFWSTIFIPGWIPRYYHWLQNDFPPTHNVSLGLWEEIRILTLPMVIPLLFTIIICGLTVWFILRQRVSTVTLAICMAATITCWTYVPYYQLVYGAPGIALLSKRAWIAGLLITLYSWFAVARMVYGWPFPPLIGVSGMTFIFCWFLFLKSNNPSNAALIGNRPNSVSS